MMHFHDTAVDGEWLAELKEAGLLTPDVMESIDAAMGRPESGTLNDFLLAGADVISENNWLSWLIRRYGCHRFTRAVWREPDAAWAQGPIPPDGNLPYRRCADGAVLVAVLRPDRREATIKRFGEQSVHWSASTLREMRDLHAAWRRQIGSAG
jgi:hypothetical protein